MAKFGRKPIDPIQRFNQKYIVDEETGCWNWIASLNNKGYGNFRIENKIIKAHRFSYEYYVGKLDSSLEICHKCNNPKCVNYKHLRQDTRRSNRIDMSYQKTIPNQILSIEEVIEIKKALKNCYHGQVKDLANFYKVSNKTISAIKCGVFWSHVNIS
jgi:hypothetical protein